MLVMIWVWLGRLFVVWMWLVCIICSGLGLVLMRFWL